MAEYRVIVQVRRSWLSRAVEAAAPIIRHMPKPLREIAAGLLLRGCRYRMDGGRWRRAY